MEMGGRRRRRVSARRSVNCGKKDVVAGVIPSPRGVNHVNRRNWDLATRDLPRPLAA